MNHLSISDVRAIVVSCVAATTLTLVAIPVVAQNSGPTMFRTLSKGAWTIKFRDGASDRKICLRTGQELVQLRHRDAGCSQFLVEDGATKVTVQYTCPGNGYGRTSIRRETPTLVQLESQGIEGDLPFQLVAEARRTGSC